MVAEVTIDENIKCLSLEVEAWQQALKERWYQSEQAGRDVGETAIRLWVHRHWPGFVRHRWIQHMLGEQFWLELKREEYAILRDTPVEVRPLLDTIIDKLICGAENLNLVQWLRQRCPEERKVIRKLLCTIDINSHRLRCYFADEPCFVQAYAS
jgi:hypothetical protein